MPKKSKNTSKPTVIEIDDSTDDESTNTSDSHSTITNSQKRTSATISTGNSTEETKTQDQEEPSCSSSSIITESKKSSEIELVLPKRVMSRRKSVHHSIRSTEDMSFECDTARKRRESVDDTIIKRNKPNQWNESQIDDAVDCNLGDPEIEAMLKKIAYCRVFTNYLLRRYDMLAIDFKLYSNLDMLNLDLKMRLDTYTAIRNSRQRFKVARELNNGQIEL